MPKSPKINTLPDELIKRASSMFDEIASQIMRKAKEVINREKRSKKVNEEKQFKNINKNLQSFLAVLSSHKLQDHAYQ